MVDPMLPNETRSVEWRRAPYTMSTDRARIDLDFVHHSLSEESYWSRGIEREVVVKSINGSIPIGIYVDDEQVGFARVVTDGMVLAYLMDVFIDRRHRGKGLGVWLAQEILTHPDLARVQRWLLSTLDAHAVYERAGWRAVEKPEWMMEVVRPRGSGVEQALGGATKDRP
jgi:GNAT superfamily N-acetyltransferase